MNYELMMLCNPEFSEEQIDELIQKYETYINKTNGEFLGAEKWGKKPIQVKFRKHKNISHANHILINFTDTKNQLTKLNYKLKIDDQVIRHMIVKQVKTSTKKESKAA